ncbi:Uncharacterised protein [Mycobacteroides abscessus subsp. abscessus]|nr:Uncharacterised protein [Mycobacteroides abscessus subsp. abscessus]
MLRRKGDSREATMLYTSNGSACAHQRVPQASAPAMVTHRYPSSQIFTAPRDPGSALASSSQTNRYSPAAAGQ